FFQAIAVPSDGRDLFAIDIGRPRGDPLQHANHVHFRFVLHPVAFPVAGLSRAILAQHAHFERIGTRVAAAVAIVRSIVVVRVVSHPLYLFVTCVVIFSVDISLREMSFMMRSVLSTVDYLVTATLPVPLTPAPLPSPAVFFA